MTIVNPVPTWEFMTAAPVLTPAPLKIVPTNITRRDANQDMSGMQATKPAPATHRFTNIPVPAPTKRAADRPATANINPAPVPTAKPGTAKNASALQVINTPVTAPTKAPAEPAATENTNLVTAAEHMIGTEAPAAVRLLTGILVPEPMKPAVKELFVTGNMKAAFVNRHWNGNPVIADVLVITGILARDLMRQGVSVRNAMDIIKNVLVATELSGAVLTEGVNVLIPVTNMLAGDPTRVVLEQDATKEQHFIINLVNVHPVIGLLVTENVLIAYQYYFRT